MIIPNWVMIAIFAIMLSLLAIGIHSELTNKKKKSDEEILIDSLKYEIFKRDSVLYLEGQYVYRIRQIYGIPDSIPFEPMLMNKYPPKIKSYGKE